MHRLATKSNSQANKAVRKTVKKELKKIPSGVKAAIVIALLIGIGAGAVACRILSGKDRFELVGQKTFTVEVGSDFTYTEEGVEAFCFGLDMSGKTTVSTDLSRDAQDRYVIPTDEEGVYTITYTVDALKFNGALSGEAIKRVRTFTVVSAEEDGHNG